MNNFKGITMAASEGNCDKVRHTAESLGEMQRIAFRLMLSSCVCVCVCVCVCP